VGFDADFAKLLWPLVMSLSRHYLKIEITT